MKAIPVVVGRAVRNSIHASNPPADAPIPTTENDSPICGVALEDGLDDKERLDL
jgi:hypothetical protein